MEAKQFKQARRVALLKQRGYFVILALSIGAMTVDLATKIADRRLTPVEMVLFPASYLIIGVGMAAIWRRRWVKQIEVFIFGGAAGAALVKLYDTLFLQSGDYQMRELINLLFWLPLVYMLAFTLFDHLRSSILVSAGFMVLGLGVGVVLIDSFSGHVNHPVDGTMLPMRFTVISVAYILILSWTMRLKEIFQKVVGHAEALDQMAHTDALTALPNRRAFMKNMETEMTRAVNFDVPFSLALFDLDNFKIINDSLGHLAGDETLKELAQFVHAQLRRGDHLFRFGGDEFILVFPDTKLQDAVQIANRLRMKVEAQKCQHGVDLTISLGVTTVRAGEGLDEVIRRSDQALYLAKSQGKNQVAFLD